MNMWPQNYLLSDYFHGKMFAGTMEVSAPTYVKGSKGYGVAIGKRTARARRGSDEYTAVIGPAKTTAKIG